ncbi:TonB-dependent receptor [uncultured Phenylobacterium sp.]|uniref:TonB-dependent receptor n=1 Tax=uncultured Phenylobacterium sp. TaxID=349273 RepID=UPI0025E5E087|nr:TonB-dependent receptor [uncultured Phenylobacterium sp.]
MAALGLASQAHEQEDQRRAGTVSEIVVTAEKRSASIQDVPVAVTAFTAEMREETGILSAQQQLNFTPGVTYEGPGGRVTIRGIGQASLGPFGLDPGVAVYQDGFYVADAQYLGGSTLSVERTEVLRGPQGTLYGRNSIGGALNSISRRPDKTPGGEFRVGANNFEGYNFEGRVSGPLTDYLRASLRVSADHQNEGYFTNLAGAGDEGGNGHGASAEAQVSFDVGSSIEGWARYLTQRRTSHPRASTAVSNPDPRNTPGGFAGLGNQGIPNVFFNIGPQYGNWGSRDFSTNRQAKTKLSDFHLFTGELIWHASDAFDVKYVVGANRYKSLATIDRDATANLNLIYPRDLSFGAFPANFDTNPATAPANGGFNLSDPNVEASFIPFRNDLRGKTAFDFDSFSHEINVISTHEGPLQWLLGAYYYSQDSGFLVTDGFADEPFYTGIVPDSDFVKDIGHLETRSKAVFGQVDYQVTPEWKATLGLRYSHDKKRGVEGLIYTGFIPGGFVAGGVFFPFDVYFATCGAVTCGPGADGSVAAAADNTLTTRSLKDSWSAVTGTAALQWTPNDDTNVYARYSRGYKSGGFNLGNVAADPNVDKETIDTYELGWKQNIGQSLRLNSAIFFYKYQDMQLSNAEIINNLQVTSLVNVKQVENLGAEFEAAWSPFEGLYLQANYAYLRSKITDGCCFVDSSDPAGLQPGAQPVTPAIIVAGQTVRGQSLVGNSVPGTPKHKFGLNATYSFDLPVGSASVSATYVWRDGYYSQLFNTPNWSVPSGETVDLRAVWRSPGERFSVIGTVSNLFDEDVPISIFTGTPQQSNFQAITLQPPRVVSVELQYRF